MKRSKCLIVDDSAIYRTQIKRAVEQDKRIEVIDVAENGREGILKIEEKQPDIVILDLEMPECDGIQTLEELNKRGYKGNIILFASQTRKSAESTLFALELGAKDFVAKPGFDDGDGSSPLEKIKNALIPKIHALLKNSQGGFEVKSSTVGKKDYQKVPWKMFLPKILVIGSSTGGPTALENLFKMLRPPFSVPIVITQHMPPVFTATFADRLAKLGNYSCQEASDGLLLQPNNVYIAKGGFHMDLVGSSGGAKIRLFDGPEINFIKPAVDPLFDSAARIYGDRCLGMVLTGMGHDGCAGAVKIKNSGGCVLIQDKESCAVWGMPATVFNEGCFDECLDLKSLADRVNDKISLANDTSIKGVV